VMWSYRGKIVETSRFVEVEHVVVKGVMANVPLSSSGRISKSRAANSKARGRGDRPRRGRLLQQPVSRRLAGRVRCRRTRPNLPGRASST
jgi:hypothetical protein